MQFGHNCHQRLYENHHSHTMNYLILISYQMNGSNDNFNSKHSNTHLSVLLAYISNLKYLIRYMYFVLIIFFFMLRTGHYKMSCSWWSSHVNGLWNRTCVPKLVAFLQNYKCFKHLRAYHVTNICCNILCLNSESLDSSDCPKDKSAIMPSHESYIVVVFQVFQQLCLLDQFESLSNIHLPLFLCPQDISQLYFWIG